MTIESLEQFLSLISTQFLSLTYRAFDVQYLKPGRDRIAFEPVRAPDDPGQAAAWLVNGEIVAPGRFARIKIIPPAETYLVAVQYRETSPGTPYLLAGVVQETPIASFASPAGRDPSARIAVGMVFFGHRAGWTARHPRDGRGDVLPEPAPVEEVWSPGHRRDADGRGRASPGVRARSCRIHSPR
ncbi:MAG: hypothetical protein JO250_20525 [Armatimonadetes bacterium]|nr:hypothetical protein [Armatimonadota bacterium]